MRAGLEAASRGKIADGALISGETSDGENANAREKGAQSLQIRYVTGVHHIATNRGNGHHESIYRAGIRHRRQGFTGQNCNPVGQRFNTSRIEDCLP